METETKQQKDPSLTEHTDVQTNKVRCSWREFSCAHGILVNPLLKEET